MGNALDKALVDLNKTYGLGTVQRMDDAPIQEIDVIPTGSLNLDLALGVKGYPRGRVIEIYGPESSGKTTLAIHAIVEAQALGLECAFIDAEHAFDKQYAENVGVNVSKVILCQPDDGEQGLEVLDKLARTGEIGLIVVDSVAALTPRAELEGEMGESKVGLQARMMSQAMRKIVGTLNKTNTTCIFINQLRMKIGVMFGDPRTTTGGEALKFYASQRLDVSRSAGAKDAEGTMTSNTVKVKIAKNKVAPPFRVAQFEIEFGRGINRNAEVLDLAVSLDVVKKSGSWFAFEETKLGQGRNSVLELMEDNPDMVEDIYQKCLNKM